MKKNYFKFLITMISALVLTINAIGQSVTMPDITANAGESILVPVHTQDLTNVAVVKLYIYIDPTVLTYTGVTNVWPGAATTLVNFIPSQSMITVQFFSLAGGVNFPNDKYLDLQFTFNGGYSDFTFDPASVIQEYPNLATIPTTFVEGSVSSPSVNFNLTVFLEGAYDSNTNQMKTDLYNFGMIPTGQPFNPTLPYYGNNDPEWYYDGTENIATLPTNAVDWVFVQLRDAATAAAATEATIVAEKPCILLNDGSVVDLDGISNPQFYTSFNEGAFVVIYHRNHLGIMSANAVGGFGGSYAYNFSTGSNKVAGGAAGYTELEAGVWGMSSGDLNADNMIDSNDNLTAWSIDAAGRGYLGSDANLNAEVNNPDKNDFVIMNQGKNAGIPQ